MALSVPKRKNRKHFSIEMCPQNLHPTPQNQCLATRKWFFCHCYVQNIRFLKILECPDFNIFFGHSWHLFHPKKLDRSDGGFDFSKHAFSCHVNTDNGLYSRTGKFILNSLKKCKKFFQHSSEFFSLQIFPDFSFKFNRPHCCLWRHCGIGSRKKPKTIG